MIIIFHSLYFIAKFLLKFYRRRTALRDFHQNYKQWQELSKEEAATTNNESDLEALVSLKFDPPVYLQRYCDVQEILLDVRWGSEMAKIVEFGCAELKLFTYLKRLLYVKEILHIDIDEELLKDSLFRIEPLTVDHLVQRSHPLLVQVLGGSVSDPDYRLRGADAVIGIELIEHLYPDTLEALPYNIFSYIRPKVVIFTTPNADFNVLFPNFSGIRHYDHKFEWTRAQFQDWCENIIKRFPQYSVSIQGCGSGPAGTEHLGSCSQMAVFIKDYDCVESEVPSECCNIYKPNEVTIEAEICVADVSYGICTYYSYSKVLEELSASSLAIVGSLTTAVQDNVSPETSIVASQNFYRLVHKIDYPFYPDDRTPNEIKLDEAKYKIHQARIYRQRYFVEDLGRLEIPVYDLICNNHGQISTVVEMSKLLLDAGFNLEQCVCDGSGQPATCVIQYPDMDSSGRTSVSEVSDPPAANEDDPSTTHCPGGRKQLDYWNEMLQEGNEEEECWDNDTSLLRKDEKDDGNAMLPSNRLHLGAISAALTNITEHNIINTDSKPSPGHNSDQLIDSGYQKSITSTAEWSPQSPLQDGMFEEQFNSCGGRSPVDTIDGLVDQEDRSPIQKKTFICALGSAAANIVVGNEIGACAPPPGTSATNGKKMKRDGKDSTGTRKKTRSKVHDLMEEDVRDLTQCLILNSLNILPLEEPLLVQSPDLSPTLAAEQHQLAKLIIPVLEKPQQNDPQVDLEPDESLNPIIEGDANDLPIMAAPIEAIPLHPQGLPLGPPGIVLEHFEMDALVGPGVVENGDLANNNRDLEGNNYPDIEMEVIQEHIRRDIHDLEDNLNENIENHVDVAVAIGFPIIPQRDHHQDELQLANHNQDVANRNNVQNMPELAQQHQQQQVLIPALVEVNEQQVPEINMMEQQLHGIRLPPPVPPSSMNVIEIEPELSHSRPRLLHQRENMGGMSCAIVQSSEPPELAEVHRASREALFDSDSQIDLLDDLPLLEVANVYENVDEEVDDHGQRPRNIVLVGVNNYDEGMDDPFPHWLLQLLGDDGDQHDAPHFYCQGDGVGVHPSIVEVDIEDDEQSTSSSSADTSSAEDNAAATMTVILDETEQPISLASSSAGTLNEAFDLVSGQNRLGLEVIGLSVHPRLNVDHLTPPNPPPSSVATTPLDAISPRTSLDNIATATTNLLDLNISNNTDRDSSDELFFDTTEDFPLAMENVTCTVPRSEGRLEENLAASEIVVGSSFGCFEEDSTSSSEAGSKTSHH